MALRLDRINRTWIMLFVAIVMALAAAWLTKKYLEVREQRLQEELASKAGGGPTARVVVPVKNLMAGNAVSGDVVAARSIPADLVSSDMITPDTFDKHDGAKLLREVERGRPLRTSDIEEKGKDFSDLIDPGSRAITIDIGGKFGDDGTLLGHDPNCGRWIRKFSGDRFAAQSHGGVEAGGSARRRDLMPVRLTIQSESNPRRAWRWSFPTTMSGTYFPVPTTRTPISAAASRSMRTATIARPMREPRVGLAARRLELGRVDEAKQALAQVKSAVLRNVLEGRLAELEGDFEQALAKYSAAIDQWPDNWSLRARAAKLAFDAGDVDRALLELREVTRHAPKETDAALQMAQIHLSRGELQEADLEDLRARLAQHDPGERGRRIVHADLRRQEIARMSDADPATDFRGGGRRKSGVAPENRAGEGKPWNRGKDADVAGMTPLPRVEAVLDKHAVSGRSRIRVERRDRQEPHAAVDPRFRAVSRPELPE